jgi:hypothetical protein
VLNRISEHITGLYCFAHDRPVLDLSALENSRCGGHGQGFGKASLPVSPRRTLNRRRMQLIADETELNRLSKVIIGCGMAVANSLGAGFVEKVYENALAQEFRKVGFAVEQQ